jgi:hypothetical protein
MPELTAAFLTAGLLLSLAGLLGFLANWRTDPDRHDLHFARTIASAGQTALAAALQLLWHDPAGLGPHTAPTIAAILAVLAASLATRLPIPCPQPG